MSVFDRISDSLKKAVLLESRVDRLDDEVKRLAQVALDHDRRLVRIETMIEIGQRGGFSPRLKD